MYTDVDRGAPGLRSRSGTGLLSLTALPPLTAHALLRETVLASQPIGPDTTELVFRIDLAELDALAARASVRCVDGDGGLPLAGIGVELDFEDGGGERATTDEHGVARFVGTPPGLRRVSVLTANGGGSRWVSLQPGSDNELGDLVVTPSAPCSGQVVDLDGKGVPASLAYSLYDTERSFELLSLGSRTDGAFELQHLPAHPLRLIAMAPGYAVSSADVTGRRNGVRIELQRVRTVRVDLARGVLVRRELRVVESSGSPLARGFVAPTLSAEWTLAPGVYAVQEIEGVDVVRVTPFTVGAEDLRLELAAR